MPSVWSMQLVYKHNHSQEEANGVSRLTHVTSLLTYVIYGSNYFPVSTAGAEESFNFGGIERVKLLTVRFI